MATIQQMNEKFYTEKGLEALTARAKSLIKLYNKGQLRAYIFGFGPFAADSEKELLHRIKEASALIGYRWKLTKTIVKIDGKEITKKEITGDGIIRSNN